MTQIVQIGQKAPEFSSVLQMFQHLAQREADEIRRLRENAARK